VDKRIVVFVLTAVLSIGSQADTANYEEVAAYVGVPPKMLYAIAMTESGLYRNGESLPWPWTLNIAGHPKRYSDRAAMFEGLMSALRSGQTRIDIGPMQVNWYWQYELISSPWTITDPVVNFKVGAAIFKRHYTESGDWWTAVGRYHRPAQTAKHQAAAEHYRGKVREALQDAFPDEVEDV